MKTVSVQEAKVPLIGYGTWRVRGGGGRESITSAIDAGYRHIDSAQMYGNEKEVGEGIRASGIPRDEVFVVSKVSGNNLSYDAVIAAGDSSLNKLDTEWIDLYLLHWPNQSYPIQETMDAMNVLHKQGIIRQIGVSNFSVRQLDEARAASEAPVLCNQVEHSPFVRHEELLAYCQQHDILFVAYTPFANGRVFKNSVIGGIGQAHHKTPAQITLRWLIQKDNVATIPKSSNAQRMVENLDVFDFELSTHESQQIDELH